MTKPFMARQGDVLVLQAGSIPGDSTPIERDGGRIVLAYGEITGHAHAIAEPDTDVRFLENDRLTARFLEVLADGGVDLRHEEHSTIHLPPGNYRVVRQREYDLASGSVRMVAD